MSPWQIEWRINLYKCVCVYINCGLYCITIVVHLRVQIKTTTLPLLFYFRFRLCEGVLPAGGQIIKSKEKFRKEIKKKKHNNIGESNSRQTTERLQGQVKSKVRKCPPAVFDSILDFCWALTRRF